jgi:predicted PurR-regulated permease PerM
MTGTTGAAAPTAPGGDFDLNDLLTGAWIKDVGPRLVSSIWLFIRNGVGGFLGVFGFLLSLVIVPLYLYYFLMESAQIKERWSEYVPLWQSRFRDEVIGTLTEINGYLVAFFRGQLLVSMINGLATGLGLVIVGLRFGWLIGLSMCVLGMIPYLGIVIAWVPAVAIASLQGGDGTWISDDPWWVFPLVVTGIFAVVQQIDGLFITPKIVGESVGLHPMTVIMSIFAWSLVLGGLLGAILAVPLSAAVKVLFQRYVWQKAAAVVVAPPGELALATEGK